MLLIIIYMAFIGLGIPDSLIGSAWPAIYTELNLPVECISCVTLLISGCTVLSSILSTKLLNKFGTHKVAAVSTAITALAILGFSNASSLIALSFFAIPLGIGAGAIDAGLNNYIALHYKANHMNFLHCFYGIGVSCSPYLMSIALSGNNWRNGYMYAFILQSIITLSLVLSFRLWKKDSCDEEEVATRNLSISQMLKMPKLMISWVIMFSTNAIEYVCGTWGSVYLIETKGLSASSGALALTLYYAGMALGRFSSGVFASKVHTWKRIYISIVVLFFAILLMLMPGTEILSIAGLFLIGFGNGSIYPNFIHLTPYNFGKDISQAIMGSQIATAYIGVMIAPPLYGAVSNILGLASYPFFIGVLYVIMVLAVFAFVNKTKQDGRYTKEA